MQGGEKGERESGRVGSIENNNKEKMGSKEVLTVVSWDDDFVFCENQVGKIFCQLEISGTLTYAS